MLARLTLALASIVLLTTSLPTLAAADLLPWDQEHVTALGQELADSVSAVRQTTLRNPSMRDVTSQRRGNQYLETLRSLERSTRQLAGRLAKGEDREQTMGLARRIGSLLRDAQNVGRKMMATQGEWNEIDRVIAVLDQISPYYSDSSPLMPNPMHPR